MKSTCKLCGLEKDIKESHLIPKFIGKWLKETGITGYLRFAETPSKRSQDLAKEYLLCGECEGLFSDWERKFANQIFYPFVNENKTFAEYDEWLLKFCVSLSWRTLIYIRSKNSASEKEADTDYIEKLNNAELILRRFLLAQEKSPLQYEQHLFPLEPIVNTNHPSLPANINRYFLRTVSMDIVGNDESIFIYTKLPRFILLGVIHNKNAHLMKPSKISLRHGRIHPRTYVFPAGFDKYLFEKANQTSDAHDAIPDSHKEKFEDFIRKNPEKVLNSKLFEAFEYDLKQFGKDAFR